MKPVTQNLKETGNSSQKEPAYDFYDKNNRMIAYGSATLANMGYDQNEWKAVSYWEGHWCTERAEDPETHEDIEVPTTIETSSNSNTSNEDSSDDDTTSSKPSEPNCGVSHDVVIVTNYDVTDCDGKPMITRRGIGINLTSRTEGDVFDWAEGYYCDPDFPLAANKSLMDKNRPLLKKHLIKK